MSFLSGLWFLVQMKACFGFGYQTAYLAMTYFDRFLVHGSIDVRRNNLFASLGFFSYWILLLLILDIIKFAPFFLCGNEFSRLLDHLLGKNVIFFRLSSLYECSSA